MRKRLSEEEKLRRYAYVFLAVFIVSLIAFASIFVLYSKKAKESAESDLIKIKTVSDIVQNDDTEIAILEETSISNDKTVHAFKNETKAENEVKLVEVKNENKTSSEDEKNKNEIVENKVNEQKAELKFVAPISGEIIKDFAVDTLVYSNTLEEWTTHNGIDIKGNKTAVVYSAEAGVVESIKNDPRYGLTVVIRHNENFKSVYANLLSSEFVKEGDTVEKEQAIGTIGQSASFEVADEPHLHFELYKDDVPVNPTLYF